MDFTFRQAKRSNAKPLIGIYAQSGCGKTKGALLLARGFVGSKGRIGMIETEAGRGEIFQGEPPVGDYEVLSMSDEFSPMNFGKAIDAAGRAKLDALIIDSASHEWESTGGVLDMADKSTATGVLKWQKPKMDHTRHFMLKLLATPIPLVIVCMRAKYPMEQRPKPGKPNELEWVRSTQLEPKQSDDILFEMLTHFWIDPQHKVHVTRYARKDMEPVIPEGSIITVETGERLAAWARGQQVESNPPAKRDPAAGTQSDPGSQRREDTDEPKAFDPERFDKWAFEQLGKCTTLEHVEKVVAKLGPRRAEHATWSAERGNALGELIARKREEFKPKPTEQQSEEPQFDDDEPL